MKIIHLVDYLMPTMGYQEFLLPKWNAKQGCEVTILTSDRYQPVPNYEDSWQPILGPRLVGTSEEVIDEVKIHRLPVAFEVKGRPWISGISHLIKTIKPDLIYCHGTGSFSIYRVARIAKKQSIPVVADNHMIMDVVQKGLIQDIYYFLHRNFVKRNLQNEVYKFIGVTEESSEYLANKEGVSPKNIVTIQLGVDTDLFYKRSVDEDLKIMKQLGASFEIQN